MWTANKLLAQGKRATGYILTNGMLPVAGQYGITPMPVMEYEFTDTAGNFVKNKLNLNDGVVLTADKAYFLQQLKSGDTVDIIYQPDNPSHNYPEALLRMYATQVWDKLLLKIFLILALIILSLIILGRQNI